MDQLVIIVTACATISKYKNYIKKIEETWGKRAEQLGVKVLFFLGEEDTDLKGNQYVYLKGVQNDYLSASYKQNLGLKYVYDAYHPNFVYCCGSDTFVNVDKMLELVKRYDHTDPLCIGGHLMIRNIYINCQLKSIYSFSGGGGFILSQSMIKSFYQRLENMTSEWITLTLNGNPSLTTACDVCIGFFVTIHSGHLVCMDKNFTGCNYNGNTPLENIPICCQNVKYNRIVACHYMSSDDFDIFNKILVNNNYLVDQPIYPHTFLPDCTLVLTCTSAEEIKKIPPHLYGFPCYQIYYCSSETLHKLVDARKRSGYIYMTIFYCFTNDQLKQNKLTSYHYVSRTIKNNPFNTKNFMWLDIDTSRFNIDQIMKIMKQITDKFHVYITKVINNQSRPNKYNLSISPKVFTCGIDSGNKILNKITSLTEITNITCGDIIIEEAANAVKSYGSEEYILDNFLRPLSNIYYTYFNILNEYQACHAYVDACNLAQYILDGYNQGELHMNEETYLNIIYCYYVSAFYCHKPTAKNLVHLIEHLRDENPRFDIIFNQKSEFYEKQFDYIKSLP